jgi:hypothetical protein
LTESIQYLKKIYRRFIVAYREKVADSCSGKSHEAEMKYDDARAMVEGKLKNPSASCGECALCCGSSVFHGFQVDSGGRLPL